MTSRAERVAGHLERPLVAFAALAALLSVLVGDWDQALTRSLLAVVLLLCFDTARLRRDLTALRATVDELTES